MAADEARRAHVINLSPPTHLCRESVASIRRQHVQHALDRLESHGDVTPAQRAAIEAVAAGVATSLAPAAIETVRTARITASTPNE